jgi:polyisoprenoid-binding protein YceI
MKKIIALLATIVLAVFTYGQHYIPVNDSSTVAFTIKNLGFNVHGSFSGLKGKINFDPAHPEQCSFDMSIDANTVNTDNNMRDNHLRSEDFFDIKNHPQITFVSTRVTKGSKAGTFFMEGNLTIKKISQPISFPFTVIPTTDGYRMEGGFETKRKPFTVGKSSTISDKLTVSLKVLARKV